MAGVFLGFAVISAVILLGWIVGRTGVLGEDGVRVLSRLVFFVLTPCLLFTVLADANVHLLFSASLLVAAICSFLVFGTFVLVALAVWKRSLAEATIGALAAGYVNANNIGIPVAVFVLGDAGWSAPVVLLQLLVISPIALTILDSQRGDGSSLAKRLLQQAANPMLIGSALGVIVAITGLQLPEPVLEPFRLVGAAAVPVVLVAFGMSLHGSRLLSAGSARRDVFLALALKLVAMPLVAWLAGRFLFGLAGHELFVVVTLAALPTGQIVFTLAQRYEKGEILARDTVLLTTVLSLPLLTLVALLLAPAS